MTDTKSKNLLFVDFETYFSTKEKYDLKNISMVEYIRDKRFKPLGVAVCNVDNEPEWLSLDALQLSEEFGWDEVDVVSHNVKFDGFILIEHFGICPRSFIDTKSMARAVLGKTISGYSLRELAKHFGLPEKGLLQTDGLLNLTIQQEKELAEYCKHDVWLCREIFLRLAEAFPENQYAAMNQTIEMFVYPKLQLNKKLLEDAYEKEKARREESILRTNIPKEEFSSNKLFPEMLIKAGYTVPSKKSPTTGKLIPALSLNDPEFLALGNTQDPVLKGLYEARVAAKSTLLETRCENLVKLADTGPWPFDVEFSGATQTHRYSGGSGAGGNPQNFIVDSVLREAIEAPPGYLLVVGDFSQIEARLVAYLSKDRAFIAALEGDPYCDFATSFYGRPITKADKRERKFGKTAILGLGYNMGAKKFKQSVFLQTGEIILDKEAKRAVNLFRAKYYQVPQLWNRFDNQIGELQRHGWGVPTKNGLVKPCTIKLPSGLYIQYPNLRMEKDEWVYDIREKKAGITQKKLYGGKILENVCQALAGELCKEKMLVFGRDVVGQVHDEIILCVPEIEAEEKANLLWQEMTKAPTWLPEMEIKAEVKIGKNWRMAK